MDSIQDISFRFLALPQELRDYIYSDILTTTYLVDLPQPWVYLSARGRGRSPPSQHCASSHLAILQVSKSTHHEAKQILFGLSIFRFKYPSTGLPGFSTKTSLRVLLLAGPVLRFISNPKESALTLNWSRLYQDLTKRSAATLMQNIAIQLDILKSSLQSNAKILQPTTLILHFFGGPSILRTNCVIQVRYAVSSDFLLEASFLDALGKLTGFKAVAVKLKLVDANNRTVRSRSSTYGTLDEYLGVMLGAGEAAKFDKGGFYCLTYHPRGRAAYRQTALA